LNRFGLRKGFGDQFNAVLEMGRSKIHSRYTLRAGQKPVGRAEALTLQMSSRHNILEVTLIEPPINGDERR
jgi:hypothetical protein